jgi:hypothetical protein
MSAPSTMESERRTGRQFALATSVLFLSLAVLYAL